MLFNVAGLFAMMSLGAYVCSKWVLEESFSTIESAEAREDWVDARQAIQAQVSHLDDRALDWSEWDDAADYYSHRNPAFLKSNLSPEILESMGLDLLAYFDHKGGLVAGESIRRFPTILRPDMGQVWNAALRDRPDLNGSASGLVKLDGGIAIISMHPVTRSSGAGKVFGRFIMVKYLDPDFIRQLGKGRGASMSLEPLNYQEPRGSAGLSVYPIDDQSLAIVGSVNGLGGAPLGRLRLITSRDISISGQYTLFNLIAVLILLACLFMVALHFMLQQVIVGRLLHLRREVSQVNVQRGAGYITVEGADEITEVASSMKAMLDTISSYTLETEAQREALAKTNDDLERQVLDRTIQLLETNSILMHALDGICRLTPEGEFQEANLQAGKILKQQDLQGASIYEFLTDHSREDFCRALVKLRTQDRVEVELEAETQGNRQTWIQAVLLPARDRDATVASVHLFFKDISESKELNEKIQHQAFFDPLTGLVNRTLFQEKLDACLEAKEGLVGVMFIDLDNFKYINDSMGHDFGDLLLIEVANRISLCTGPDDTVARMGGDEFSVLLPSITSPDEADRVAAAIVESLAEPVRIFGRDVFATASVGLCVSKKAEARVSELLRSADTAMYEAKANGKATYSTFDDSMSEKIVERIKLESGLRAAINDHEITILFQPIVELGTGRIMGAESLARWNSPTLGFVSPASFIPIAEETGLIIPLGASVLDDACKAAADWRRRIDPHFHVNVNLSLRQLLENDLVDAVRLALDHHELDPSGLHLEITESLAVRDYDRVIHQLNALKSIGVGLAIDDFGTGYSSLSYLQRLPIDTVKIDRSFVTMLGVEQAPTAIIMAIITLCRAMGFRVVAEGVETVEQVARLEELGCHSAQGFLYSKPISMPAMEAFILNGREARAA